jgi:ERCC4-related helicase
MLLMSLIFDKNKNQIFILVPSDSLRTQHKNFIEKSLGE